MASEKHLEATRQLVRGLLLKSGRSPYFKGEPISEALALSADGGLALMVMPVASVCEFADAPKSWMAGASIQLTDDSGFGFELAFEDSDQRPLLYPLLGLVTLTYEAVCRQSDLMGLPGDRIDFEQFVQAAKEQMWLLHEIIESDLLPESQSQDAAVMV